MATVEITANDQINFAPATEREEIIQNIGTLLATMRYSVPYHRSLGLSATWLDDPSPSTRAQVTAEVIQKVRRHEPRADVTEVVFDEDGREGLIKPKVRVNINA